MHTIATKFEVSGFKLSGDCGSLIWGCYFSNQLYLLIKSGHILIDKTLFCLSILIKSLNQY